MIFPELPIRTDTFDWDEYQRAKRAVKKSKSFGEDGIPPEVIKRCNIDDIILEFCNEALLNKEKAKPVVNTKHDPSAKIWRLECHF